MDVLEKILREEFKIEHDRYGVQSVTTKDDAYSHVILELSTFTLGDFEIKKMIEACNKTDGLFINPEKLLQLKELNVKTIVVQTTGQNGQEVNKLVDFFERMNFIPENVVFIFTKLLHIGREFKKAHPETNFFLWWHDNELEHLEKIGDF
jgi:hypothetical protein